MNQTLLTFQNAQAISQ